jgi:tetratricopeptide (TPR) repeat protein
MPAHCMGNALPEAIWHFSQVLPTAQEIGDPELLAIPSGAIGLSLLVQGRTSKAELLFRQAMTALEQMGNLSEEWVRALAHHGAAIGTLGNYGIVLLKGRIQEALDLAEQAMATAKEMDSLTGEALASRAWGQALAALEPPRWDEAEARFAEALRIVESIPSPPYAAHTHLVWGTVCRDRGDLAAAREHWEQAAAQWEACGITWHVDTVRGRYVRS